MMDNTNMILAENIRKFRKASRLTQEELAGKLGVTFQAVSKWENGRSAPDVAVLPCIARIFDITMDELFDYDRAAEEVYPCCQYSFGLSLDDFFDRVILDHGEVKECQIFKCEDPNAENRWEVRIHIISTEIDFPYILQEHIKPGRLADGYCIRYSNGEILDDDQPNKYYVCCEKIWEYKNTDSSYVKRMIKEQLEMGLIDEE